MERAAPLPLALATGLAETDLYIGRTPAMRRAAELALAVAGAERTSALILGESGTGKELVARAIHHHSRRASRPFVALNCGAIVPSLAESELFGAERGGYTDARARRGQVELAHTGTLFLDEIGELPASVQRTLLRFLETRQYRRVGAERPAAADVRVLAATLRDLTAAAQGGAFRDDLLYRINVVTIWLPPLRARPDDLPALIALTLRERARALGLANPPECAAATLALLGAYRWPGNARELRNVLEQALILCRGATITPDHLPVALRAPPPAPAAPTAADLAARLAALDLPPEGVCLPDLVRLLEDRLIAQALARTAQNQSRAATLLGLTRDQLRQRRRRAL